MADRITQLLTWEFDSYFSTKNDYLILDIRRNKRVDEQHSERPKNFLDFPYYLDIEISKKAAIISYKKMIAELFCRLREEGWQVVTACAFEEELPENGRNISIDN